MCGITGFIGQSKDPKLTFDLITRLFITSKTRGSHASGFWASTDAQVTSHKAPIPSSEFVTLSPWLNLLEFNSTILLAHARHATMGDPNFNQNNHPFVDDAFCLVHNGKILEYDDLKNLYPLSSQCDSEVLFRIYQDKKDVAELFSLIQQGFMAVGIGEMNGLWLFRNEYRPLWLVDVRAVLGQIFFCSTLEIWEEARLDSLNERLYPLGPNEVWHLTFLNNILAQRFKVVYN